jgi:cytochrome c
MNHQGATRARRSLTGWAAAALVGTLLHGAAAYAQGSDAAEGEKLYVSQCKLCHGNAAAAETGELAPVPPSRQVLRVAMRQPTGSAIMDVPAPLMSGWTESAPRAGTGAAGALAFAPPFGPNLRGVYGRPAGSVKDYQYSPTFLKTLKGMEWNDAALAVWITNPQAWVPGVYMFYKQPDPEIRRKIILYLKANSNP